MRQNAASLGRDTGSRVWRHMIEALWPSRNLAVLVLVSGRGQFCRYLLVELPQVGRAFAPADLPRLSFVFYRSFTQATGEIGILGRGRLDARNPSQLHIINVVPQLVHDLRISPGHRFDKCNVRDSGMETIDTVSM